MSEVFGVNQTKIDAGGIENQLEKGLRDGRLKVCYDEYEAAALAAASTIEMCGELPKGAVIYDVILMNDALGASVTIAVGDSADADRYIAAADMSSATRNNLDRINGLGYTIGTTAGDNQLLLTTAGAAATGTIKVKVIYSQD